jgi:hypothetical protein
MELFDGLLDDETLRGRPQAGIAEAVAEHQRLRDDGTYGRLLATLLVPDTQLAQVSRLIPAGASIPVSVTTSGGAGGLLALARRDLAGVAIVSAEPALRDLDDLAGSAARIVSAAAELAPEIAIFVELPYAPGWEVAVELIEAGGLNAKIDISNSDPRQRVEQLSILIEADLPFKITGRVVDGWLALLTTVDALVEGASLDDAVQLTQAQDHDRIHAVVSGWDQMRQSRIRRRVRRLGTDTVQDVINNLRAQGVLAAR